MPLTVTVIGCEHSQGLSKKDDRPYNFALVNYLAPNEGWKSEKGACEAVGLDKKQIAMNPPHCQVKGTKEMHKSQSRMLTATQTKATRWRLAMKQRRSPCCCGCGMSQRL